MALKMLKFSGFLRLKALVSLKVDLKGFAPIKAGMKKSALKTPS
jgi:hypothetical protein